MKFITQEKNVNIETPTRFSEVVNKISAISPHKEVLEDENYIEETTTENFLYSFTVKGRNSVAKNSPFRYLSDKTI